MKTSLLSTTALVLMTVAVSVPAMAADYGHPYPTTPVNYMEAAQTQSATVSDSTVADTTSGPTAPPSFFHPPAPAANPTQTGSVNYGYETFSGSGIYTLQNQLGYNDATNNGTQIAAQVNGNNANNSLVANQSQGAAVTSSSADGVNNTGSVNYAAKTFDSGIAGLFTLQNTTGLNAAGNNGTQIAAQYNQDNKVDSVVAHQGQSASINDSTSKAKAMTGDITYGNETFAGNGLFTLQNTTGVNNAVNNGTQIAAQLGDSDVQYGTLVASQDMGAAVSNNSATTIDITGGSSRTGNINYAPNTFSGVGVYTISNTTGVNAAANNATQIAVQLNTF